MSNEHISNKSAQPTIAVSALLADFIVRTEYSDLDNATVNMAKRCLQDAIGVSIAASSLGEGCQSFKQVADCLSSPSLDARHSDNDSEKNTTATLLGFSEKKSPVQAAWVNGALAHALDFEDAHDETLTHPNAAAVAGLLAAAETPNLFDTESSVVSGKDIITAMVLGCEIVCRLARGLTKPLDDFGWYPPPILGAFGAAAAIAKLYRLTATQIVDAFSLVLCNVSCSAEIKYNPQSTIRAVRDAFAAQTGLQSVLLAKAGVSGFEKPFEGKAGFYQNFARGFYSPEKVVEGIELKNSLELSLNSADSTDSIHTANFAIKNISFKAWPSCRGTHAFIEAALQLKAQHSIVSNEIKSIHAKGCRINRMLAEPLITKQSPQSAIDAKFSIPFTVAVALTKNAVTLENFLSDGLSDKDVLFVSSLVTYSIDNNLDDSPETMTIGNLSIILNSGEEYATTITTPYGSQSRPLSKTLMDEKFKQCCGYSAKPMSESTVSELLSSIDRMEEHSDLSEQFFSYLSF